jgi:hypothetical protein
LKMSGISILVILASFQILAFLHVIAAKSNQFAPKNAKNIPCSHNLICK